MWSFRHQHLQLILTVILSWCLFDLTYAQTFRFQHLGIREGLKSENFLGNLANQKIL